MPPRTDLLERADVGPLRHLFGLSRRPGWAPGQLPTVWAITAAADGSGTWRAVLCVEGVRTLDHRELMPGGGTWRTLPLPLMGLDTTTWGHEDAILCGRIETITREGNNLVATGSWASNENGDKYQKYVEDQDLRWISIDPAIISSEFIEVYSDGGDPWGDIEPTDWWERITSYEIMGATIVPFPALPQAVIVNGNAPFPETADDNGLESLPLVASLRVPAEWVASEQVEVPVCPPAEWLEDPKLSRLTHANVDEHGRVFGHLAGWGIAHIGYPGQPVYAPRSKSDYFYFRKAPTPTATGPVRTGPLTLGTGHADLGLGWKPASDHYDNTGTAIADVVTGEDEHGIWFSGALRPGTTYAQLRAFLSSDLSGDWREINGNLELVGALVVNVGGFPTPAGLAASAALDEPELVGPVGAQVARLCHGTRVQRTGEGQATALVAAAVVSRDPAMEILHRYGRKIAELENRLALIEPAALALSAQRAAARLTLPS